MEMIFWENLLTQEHKVHFERVNYTYGRFAISRLVEMLLMALKIRVVWGLASLALERLLIKTQSVWALAEDQYAERDQSDCRKTSVVYRRPAAPVWLSMSLFVLKEA